MRQLPRAEAAADLETVAGCEAILQYVERRRAGYTILRSPVSYSTLRRAATIASTLGLAISEASPSTSITKTVYYRQ
jgi:hypothetical protein